MKYSLHLFKAFFLCLALLLTLSPLYSYSDSLLLLSREEEQDLKLLFRYLFGDNELGYVLFGNKPMSFCVFSTATPGFSVKENVFKIYKRGRIPLLSGLRAWNKIQNYISDDFVFIFTKKNHLPEYTFLINKKLFIDIVNENIDVFRKWYGSQLTAESFLSDLLNDTTKIEKLLQQHLPMGILLGYGRRNAELFQRRETLLQRREKVPFSPLTKSTQKELDDLNQHLMPVYTNNALLAFVCPVNFTADFTCKETKRLQAHYLAVHQELTALFLREDWFFKILEQMCRQDPTHVYTQTTSRIASCILRKQLL